LTAATAGCRRPEPPLAPDAGAQSADSDRFTLTDLAAATRLDAEMAEVSFLSAEYKAALTFRRGDELQKETDQAAKNLERAVGELERAFEQVKHPRDREKAGALVAAARRWPALLAATRAELLAPTRPTPPVAAASLAETDDAVARALEDYRRFRSGWKIAGAPQETPQVTSYLEARQGLERLEGRLGGMLPGPGAPAASSKVVKDLAGIVEAEVNRARLAADGVEEPRRGKARAWIDGQARALTALVAMADGGGKAPEELGRLSLAYQVAKVETLEAVAEFTQMTITRDAVGPQGSDPARDTDAAKVVKPRRGPSIGRHRQSNRRQELMVK
jgi:hypothetical protein